MTACVTARWSFGVSFELWRPQSKRGVDHSGNLSRMRVSEVLMSWLRFSTFCLCRLYGAPFLEGEAVWCTKKKKRVCLYIK